METAESARVLVVDDEPQITRVLRTVLSSHGYQVRTAAEGESALTDFKEWSPELVITDLYMPHMDGIELCKRIRAISAVPIIVVTARTEEIAGWNRDLDLKHIRWAAETLLVRDDLPIIPIYFYVGFDYFDDTKVKGIYNSMLDMHPLNAIWKEKEPSPDGDRKTAQAPGGH